MVFSMVFSTSLISDSPIEGVASNAVSVSVTYPAISIIAIVSPTVTTSSF